MSRLRPSPDEERWLEAAARLRGAVPRVAVAGHAGDWRSTGPLARAALFVLGIFAAALVFGILERGNGLGEGRVALIAGLVATGAAEWLAMNRRLFASGIEEGLCVAGFLMVGVWIATLLAGQPAWLGGRIATLVPVLAVASAGLRLLNPFVTTCASIALLFWADSTSAARALDMAAGSGMSGLVLGCAIAALALLLGAREFRRPSHDRMLDWLVVTTPVGGYVLHARWGTHTAGDPAGIGVAATIALLVLLGVAMLVVGLRRRRHAPLLGFMGCVACIAVEFRLVTTLAVETRLILGGLGALVSAVLLVRYLRRPRDGITSTRLTDREGPMDLLQAAGASLIAGRAGPSAPPAAPGVTAGEGRFGGGGASGGY